jgi:Recombinase
VRFQKALDNAVAKIRKAAIDRRTALRRSAYQFSPSKKLSRLYAFRNVGPDGHAEIVPAEAEVVREVIRGFAEGLPVETIKGRLDARGVRNRSRKPFSRGELVGLVRSVYASRVKGPGGILIKSRVYPPLVTRREWAQAAKNVSKELENEDFEPLPDTHDDDFMLLDVERPYLPRLDRI